LSNSTKLAHSLLRQLIELGISDFVVSPGSRNAPLLIALGEAAQKQVIDLHTKIDERGAAFFALGISKASNNYVAVVCTSGTAAANYLPAALEALHGRSKLLIITADRPARLRKTGANQTTNQVNLFQGISTHDFSSDIDIEPLLKSGPVHLNVQFDEPLVSAEKTDWLAGLRVSPRSYDNQVNGKLESTTGVLVVGHDRAGYTVSEITEFADKLGWPVIAEDPLSFPQAVAHTALFLSDPKISEKLAAQNVVVIGRTTLSRSTNNFIKLAKNLIVIDPRTKDIDSKREGNLILSQLPNEVVSQKSDGSDWQIASDLTANIITELDWSEQ
jgi:2-succinyl-5-enolpyruvyl-6-hydroxy-3-cyclohexene-1-carboxylate synthase